MAQLSTYAMTRTFSLTLQEIQSVRNLLRRRGLSVQSVRKVCKNSSTTARPISFVTVITLLIASILTRKF